MRLIVLDMTKAEKDVIESYVCNCKMAWGLFWRQAIRTALRKSAWKARHDRKPKPRARGRHEFTRLKTPLCEVTPGL